MRSEPLPFAFSTLDAKFSVPIRSAKSINSKSFLLILHHTLYLLLQFL